MSVLAVPLDEKTVKILRKKLGVDELEQKVKRLETTLLKLRRYLREELSLTFHEFNPLSLCEDRLDREILTLLMDSSAGLTTSKMARMLEKTIHGKAIHRVTVLRRLQAIAERASVNEELNPPGEEKKELFLRDGWKWKINRDVLL